MFISRLCYLNVYMMEKLADELRDLPRDFVVLAIMPEKHFEPANMRLVKYLVHELGYHGAYVAMNKPYSNVSKVMEQSNIDHNKILFIDCVSGQKSKAQNCVFLNSMESLTQIGICLDPVYKNSDLSFIFLDSLDAMSVYHDKKLVVRFVRNMIERIREHEMSGVMLGLREETDRQLINELSVVCDKVIDMTE